jgi:peptide chain release factor 1
VIEQLVSQIESRFAELERDMSDPDVIADRERYAEVGREYRQLADAHELAAEWLTLSDDLEGARELLAEEEDEELRRVVATAPARLEDSSWSSETPNASAVCSWISRTVCARAGLRSG